MRIRSTHILWSTLALLVLLPLTISATPEESKTCTPVGGVLMTDIGAIGGQINLGPVFGDLAGSVAAQILSGDPATGVYKVQHYWVTSTGEQILFDVATLQATYPNPSDPAIVAVPWGNYSSAINGGTGKYRKASGKLDYFGMADFHKNTLVLRYRGKVCLAK